MVVRYIVCERSRTMLYLRFVLEMVEQLGSGALTQPDHVISFVAHALRPDDEDQTKKQKYKNVNGAATVPVPNVALRSLRIVELEDPAAVPEEEDNEDSDDESDDDLLDTGLNLLLAVLEGESQALFEPVMFSIAHITFTFPQQTRV